MEIRPTRRTVLRGVGLTAAAVTIGPTVLPLRDLLRAAGAQEVAPTAEELMAFAETVELAAVAFYGQLRPRVSRPAAVAAVTDYAKHHQDHANALAPAGGAGRTGKPNLTLLPTLNDQLSQAKSENDALRVAYDLENSIASTYFFIIDSIDDAGDIRLAASILPIEAQHAVILGGLVGATVKDLTAPDKEQQGYESEDKHLDPATFPVAATTTTAAPAEA